MKGPMTPLQWMAVGLFVVYFSTTPIDVSPDPLGWALVLAGLSRYPVPGRAGLRSFAAVALLIAIPLWIPAIREPAYDAGPAIAWAMNLPALLFAVLLCRDLVAAARAADDRSAAGRFGTLNLLFIAVIVIPPIAHAAESKTTAAAGEIGWAVAWLWLTWSLFSHHARPWASATPRGPRT